MKLARHVVAAVLFFFSLPPAHGLPSDEQQLRPVDLFDLISIFLVSEGKAGEIETTSPDWSSGAEMDSPVEWLAEDLGIDKESQLFMREGEAVVTVDGSPIYVLKKKKEPLRWSIKLTGSKAGIDAVEISSAVNSQEIRWEFEEKLQEQDIKYKLVQCDVTGMASSGTRVYAVQFPGKNPCWIAHAWSCGSAGCSADFKVFGMDSREDSLHKLFR